MAEDIVYTLIDIPKSKKRQRTENFEETYLSELTISSQTGYHQVSPEPSTSIEINPRTGYF